jgi:hypothetical protein
MQNSSSHGYPSDFGLMDSLLEKGVGKSDILARSNRPRTLE